MRVSTQQTQREKSHEIITSLPFTFFEEINNKHLSLLKSKMAQTENDQELPSFSELGITGVLGEAIAGLGWKAPTEIQAKAIPAGLEGRDIIGLAETGVHFLLIHVFTNDFVCPGRFGQDRSICYSNSSCLAANTSETLCSNPSSDKRARVSDK